MTEVARYQRDRGDEARTLDVQALAADAGISARRLDRRTFKSECLISCSGIAMEIAA